MSSSIFNDLSVSESDRTPEVLLSDDFASLGSLDPVAPPKLRRSDEDPIEVMRKIFVGRQVDEMRDYIARLERQVVELRESLDGRMKELERSLREDMAKVAETTAEAVDQSRSSLVSVVDDKLRKLAAGSVPRSLLAEILRELGSRLQPNAG